MARCLVTGGAGFIGAHVNNALLQAGHETVVLDDLSGGFPENVNPESRFVEGSVCDCDLIEALFAEEAFDHVFHLAAYAAEGLSHFIKRFNYTNNLLGSVTLINAAVNHEVDCFVFASSIAVYGSGQLPMTEDMIPRPEDSYGIAKYAVEQELRASHEMFGLDYVIFRPHNVYGELQNIGDRYRNVVGIFMNQIMKGEPLSVFGDGSQTRAFSYVGDVAPVIARAPQVSKARCRTFNIGADRAVSVLELAHLVARAMGVPDHPILHLAPRKEVLHAFSDHQPLFQVFGVPQGTRIESGLARMAAWARRTGPRQSSRFKALEIQKGLPASWREG